MIESTNTGADSDLNRWTRSIASLVERSANITLGLVSGNRFSNDARVIYRIVRDLQLAVSNNRPDSSMLLCRLEVRSPSAVKMLGLTKDEFVEPKISKSALGNWHVVEVPVVVGSVATASLQYVPRMLPKWKKQYNLIVVDLGPLHLVTSRVVGRLCDSSFVILGPTSCASSQWISQFVSYHADCGSHIAGTVTAGAAA